MRVHYLQHVHFENLGNIEPWLQQRGYDITATLFHETDQLPDINDIDCLIVMGGPMSVHDEAEYPWLVKEKQFIRSAIDAKLPVLGICLGAQLIADVMGGDIVPNPEKEIGWFPVRGVVQNTGSTFAFPSTFNAFHWHGETFNLPPQAVLIAENDTCKHQAFQIDEHVIGLQFHLETTAQQVKNMVENCHHELIDAPYIQRDADMMAVDDECYGALQQEMANILDYLLRSR